MTSCGCFRRPLGNGLDTTFFQGLVERIHFFLSVIDQSAFCGKAFEKIHLRHFHYVLNTFIQNEYQRTENVNFSLPSVQHVRSFVTLLKSILKRLSLSVNRFPCMMFNKRTI